MNTEQPTKTESATPDKVRDFTITFEGRQRGAIGIHTRFTRTVKASDKESAILALYDEFDSVHFPREGNR